MGNNDVIFYHDYDGTSLGTASSVSDCAGLCYEVDECDYFEFDTQSNCINKQTTNTCFERMVDSASAEWFQLRLSSYGKAS